MKSVLNIHWKDWHWRWNSNTLATWYEELTHWKRPWCWERLKAGAKGEDRGSDGWMAHRLYGTPWVWVSSGSRWRTGKPGVLQSMGLQRVNMMEWLNGTEEQHLLGKSMVNYTCGQARYFYTTRQVLILPGPFSPLSSQALLHLWFLKLCYQQRKLCGINRQRKLERLRSECHGLFTSTAPYPEILANLISFPFFIFK